MVSRRIFLQLLASPWIWRGPVVRNQFGKTKEIKRGKVQERAEPIEIGLN